MLAATGAAGVGLLAGCSGILSSGPSTIWNDDFESGTLDRYESVGIPGDEGPAGFEVASEPSLGEYALTQRTEDSILVPAESVSVTPPVTATFDVYVSGWAGIDFILPWNRDTGASYELHVRNNTNGDFLDLQKVSARGSGNATAGKQATHGKAQSAPVFSTDSWERVTLRWTETAVEATTATANQTVRIEDSDGQLRGNPFAIRGYWYNGLAALDNLDIVSPGEPITPSGNGTPEI